MDNRPIGVFDSGLGGLTVVKELKKLLPNEDIIYFGDTGRVPYGTRSYETIKAYAKQDMAFLKSKNVKMIVAACGTVSSVFNMENDNDFGVLYTGVLMPAASKACEVTNNNKVGVIGTSATVKSGSYEKMMQAINKDISVYKNACPLFVPLVENGYTNKDNQVTKLVAQDYLKPIMQNDVDTLILGCTHFPLIRDIIADIMGDGVTLVNPGEQTAIYTANVLKQNDMLCERSQSGNYEFYVSDSVESFSQYASEFMGESINSSVQKIDINSY